LADTIKLNSTGPPLTGGWGKRSWRSAMGTIFLKRMKKEQLGLPGTHENVRSATLKI